IRDHLVMVLRQAIDFDDTRSEEEKATDSVQFALEDAEEVRQLAAAERRSDFLSEITLLTSQLRASLQEAERNPQAVQQRTSQARTRLERIRNVLMGTLGQSRDGKLVEG